MKEKVLLKVLEMLVDGDNSNGESEYAEDLGKSVFIKTVTHHYTGKIIAVNGQTITLESAAWIASDGRLNEVMKSNDFDEVEPFPKPIKLNTGAFLLLTEIDKLPMAVK